MKKTKKKKNKNKSIRNYKKKGGTTKKEIELSAQKILNDYQASNIDSKTVATLIATGKHKNKIPTNILGAINIARRQINFSKQEINEQKYINLASKILNPGEDNKISNSFTNKFHLLINFLKFFKIQNKEFFNIIETNPIEYLLENNKDRLKLYFLRGDNYENPYLVMDKRWDGEKNIIIKIEDDITDYLQYEILDVKMDDLIDRQEREKNAYL